MRCHGVVELRGVYVHLSFRDLRCASCVAVLFKRLCRNETLEVLSDLASRFSYDNHIMLQIAIILMYYTTDTDKLPAFIQSGVLPMVKSAVYAMTNEITLGINLRQSAGDVVYPFVSILQHLSLTGRGFRSM